MRNLFILYYILTGIVWSYRAWRALRALRENPQVQPAAPPSHPPLVSVLVPVKNEEENLVECLKCLTNQNYPTMEIIVINDHSIDRTVEILSEYSRLHPDKIRILDAPSLPPGWTGKNWALTHGVPFAHGEWLFFTDADTRHEPWSLSSAIAHAEEEKLDLLTLSPRCLTGSFWEKILQPAAMVYIGLWFPFAKVNHPSSTLSFGNGQYLMIRKRTYQAIGGHEKVKEAFLEDFALVKEVKKSGYRIECAMGTKIYGTRMYRSFAGIWRGWRRIFFHAFEGHPFLLLKKAMTVFSFSSLPFFLLPLFPHSSTLVILSLIFLTVSKAHLVVGAPWHYTFFHPLAGLILAGILSDAAWAALRRKELKWR